MHILKRNLWSTRYLYYYYTRGIPEVPLTVLGDFEIVFAPLTDVYQKYYAQLSKVCKRYKLEYLRIKLRNAEPYMVLFLSGEKVAHYSFYAKPNAYFQLRIIDNSAYVCTSFTIPEFRRRGLHYAAKQVFFSSPVGKNGLQAWIMIDNIASQKSNEKAGLKRIFKFREDIRFGLRFFHIEEYYT